MIFCRGPGRVHLPLLSRLYCGGLLSECALLAFQLMSVFFFRVCSVILTCVFGISVGNKIAVIENLGATLVRMPVLINFVDS